jgi:hypothetical protein
VDDIAHETNEDFLIEEIVPTVKHGGRQFRRSGDFGTPLQLYWHLSL